MTPETTIWRLGLLAGGPVAILWALSTLHKTLSYKYEFNPREVLIYFIPTIIGIAIAYAYATLYASAPTFRSSGFSVFEFVDFSIVLLSLASIGFGVSMSFEKKSKVKSG